MYICFTLNLKKAYRKRFNLKICATAEDFTEKNPQIFAIFLF